MLLGKLDTAMQIIENQQFAWRYLCVKKQGSAYYKST